MRQFIIIGSLLLAVGCGTASQVRNIDPGEVESVEVSILPWDSPNEKIAGPFHSTDPEVIRAVVEAVQAAEETTDHNCADRAVLVIATRAGKNLELRLLPGHTEESYEYRINGKIFRVKRSRFMAAMKQLGVKGLPLHPTADAQSSN